MHKPTSNRRSRNYTDPQHPRHIYLDFPINDPPKDNVIKIVSYNIRFSKRVKKAIALFLENAELQNADVICLQEMDPDGVNSFAKALKYNFVYYPAVVHPHHNRDFGNAILSKWSFEKDYKIILPNTPRQKLQRIAVGVKLRIHKRILNLVNVHMQVFMKPNHRSDQIDFIINSLPDSANHCVISGDFNTHSKKHRKAMIEGFAAAQFHHVTEKIGWTHRHWTSFNWKHSLDHIFTRNMKVLEFGKVLNRKASDHVPIWAKLKW